MSIEKMKLFSVVGPVNDFDRVISSYLSSFDIHIENALSLLDNVKGLTSFSTDNSYNEKLSKIKECCKSLPQKLEKINLSADYCEKNASDTLDSLEKDIQSNKSEIESTEKQIDENNQVLMQLEHILRLNIDLDDLFKFSFIKFRFGRLPKEGYKKLLSYLNDIDAFFIEGEILSDYVYGIYFMPAPLEEKIDAVFSSLYFERIIISSESHGTPSIAYEQFKKENSELNEKLNKLTEEKNNIVNGHLDELLKAYTLYSNLCSTANVKRFSAHTKDSFYVCGWIPKNDIKKIEAKFESEPDVVLIEEDPDIIKKVSPPTKLKNPKLFKPFEMFIEMYGLPSYTEIDPTPLLAFSYVVMFGIMFGDLGHGLVLAIGGFLLYKLKKMDLAAIISLAGICSMITGVMYGSVFGNEEILKALVPNLVILEPMNDINTILISTVGLGVVIILISMTMNIANAIKNKEWGKALFDQNGLSGMIFYISVLVLAVTTIMSDNKAFGFIGILFLIILPLILVFLKEPLSDWLAKKKNFIPENKGEFFLESFFELFEIILSYATNTISFIRLGAFAIGHASMMLVVYILADMTGGGFAYVLVVIIGNIFVIGLEGLIVGIQALRLEFYEMFSRYFKGDGRPFVSNNINN